MKTNRFYTSAAVALLATLVATTSCKKDESAPAVTVDALKHLPNTVNSGLYGSVKSVTSQSYSNSGTTPSVLPNSDTTDVTLAAGATPSSKSITKYDEAGYTTSSESWSSPQDCNYDPDTYEMVCTRGPLRKQYVYTYTRDAKHRTLEYKSDYYHNDRDTINRRNSTVTTYTYNDAAKKITEIRKDGFGVENSKTVYDMDADGFIDDGNYVEYQASPAATTWPPNYVTKTDKDAKGNKTLVREFMKGNNFYVQQYSTYTYEYY